MAKYIYQYDTWPHFRWNEREILVLLGKVRHLQGKLLGQMSTVGFSLQEETTLSTLTLDVLKSSEIEGEILNYDQVRSSIASRLGLEYAGMVYPDRYVEGVVEMMLVPRRTLCSRSNYKPFSTYASCYNIRFKTLSVFHRTYSSPTKTPNVALHLSPPIFWDFECI